MGGGSPYIYHTFSCALQSYGPPQLARTSQALGLPSGPARLACWACLGPCTASLGLSTACLGLSTAIPGPQYCIPWPPRLPQSVPETSQRRFGGAPGVPAGTKLTCPSGLPDLPGPQYCLLGPQYCLQDCLKDFLRTATTAACVNVLLKYVQNSCQVPRYF